MVKMIVLLKKILCPQPDKLPTSSISHFKAYIEIFHLDQEFLKNVKTTENKSKISGKNP